MPSSRRAPLEACRSALIQGFLRSATKVALDDKGYAGEAGQNLIEGVHLDDFESDLRQGDGNELEEKFRAAHSSSALAVNTFAPFKARPGELRLPGVGGFTNLNFERKCPHGLVGRRPPNLDVLADGPNGVVAIESKCLEPLTPHQAKFAPVYETGIRDSRRQTAWFREMQQLVNNQRTYRWLDAAQLVKHAFGLTHTFPNQPITLIYLFWEPSNPEAYPIFAEHRAEATRFATSIAGGGPDFAAISYPELWKLWNSYAEPDWLRAHVSRLKTRYEVAA